LGRRWRSYSFAALTNVKFNDFEVFHIGNVAVSIGIDTLEDE
jgi:hypothetical protein